MNKFNRLRIAFTLVLVLLLLAVPVFAQDAQERPSVTVSIDDLVWVVVGLAGILYGIISKFRAGKSGEQIDKDTQERLAREQHNREMMDRYERIHAAASTQGKEAFGALVGIVESFSGWTRWKGDDAFASFLRDVQKPGVPVTIPPLPPVTPASGEDTTNPKNR